MELWSLGSSIAEAGTSEAVSSEEALKWRARQTHCGRPCEYWLRRGVTCQDGRSTSRASSTVGPRELKLVVDRVGQIRPIGGAC